MTEMTEMEMLVKIFFLLKVVAGLAGFLVGTKLGELIWGSSRP